MLRCEDSHVTHENLLFNINLLLLLPLFVVDSVEDFQTNPHICDINTRYNLHVQTTDLRKYQKGVYCTGIKLFINLPPAIRCLNSGIKVFKPALK
jgi:hypothetical protein